MIMARSIRYVLAKLDEWVSKHGNGCYWGDGELPRNKNMLVHEWGPPIQQVRAEIHQFAEILWNNRPCETIMEIGAGPYGGTRYLWQMIFNQVITVEIDKSVIDRLDYHSRIKDIFIISDSRHAFPKVQRYLQGKKLDALFIDGDHSYDCAALETLIYKPLVRQGGVIGWHDTCQSHYGVGRFVKDYADGKIDGINHQITTLDLAHTGKAYGKHRDSPEGKRIGLSFMKVQ